MKRAKFLGASMLTAVAVMPSAVGAPTPYKGLYVLVGLTAGQSGSAGYLYNLGWLQSQSVACASNTSTTCVFANSTVSGVTLPVLWSTLTPAQGPSISCTNSINGEPYTSYASYTYMDHGTLKPQGICTAEIDSALTSIATIEASVGGPNNGHLFLSIGLVGGDYAPACAPDLTGGKCRQGAISPPYNQASGNTPRWVMQDVDANKGTAECGSANCAGYLYVTDSNGMQPNCLLAPDPWDVTYEQDYVGAVKGLASYIDAGVQNNPGHDNLPHPVTMLKIGGVNGGDMEVAVSGNTKAMESGCGAANVTNSQAWLAEGYTTTKVEGAFDYFTSNVATIAASLSMNTKTMLGYSLTSSNQFPLIECNPTCTDSGVSPSWSEAFQNQLIYDVFSAGKVSLPVGMSVQNFGTQTNGLIANPAATMCMNTQPSPSMSNDSNLANCQMNNPNPNNQIGQATTVGTLTVHNGPGTLIGWQDEPCMVQNGKNYMFTPTDASNVINTAQLGVNYGGKYIELRGSDYAAVTAISGSLSALNSVAMSQAGATNIHCLIPNQ